jgi:hypothetical protein
LKSGVQAEAGELILQFDLVLGIQATPAILDKSLLLSRAESEHSDGDGELDDEQQREEGHVLSKKRGVNERLEMNQIAQTNPMFEKNFRSQHHEHL